MDATIRPEGCPSSRPTRAGLALLLAVALGGCAALDGAPSASPSGSADPAGFGKPAPAPAAFGRTPPPAILKLKVTELRGSASVTRGGRAVALKKGDSIAVNEPVQVAKGGLLRLNLSDQGLLELGASARLVAYRLPSAALLGGRETSLRLENGYLRVVWSEPLGFRNWPLDVSISRWAASLKPGEYFFDAGEDEAIACSTTGEVRLMGNPETLPDSPGTCVALAAAKPARVLETSEQKWATVRSSASLRSLAAAAQTATVAAPATASTTAPPAVSGAKSAGKPATNAKKPVPAETVNMVVASTTGRATIRRRSGEVALRKGSTVSAGQPVQVGARSRVSLTVPERGWVDLGPSTRFVVHKLPESAAQGSQETWMRLERGTVRVAVAGTSSTIPPPELSFSRWAAKLGDGEYFIESGPDGATACAAKGEIKLSGVPETLPQAMTQPCVRLRASQPPVLVTPSETAWVAIRKGNSIETALAQTLPTIAAAQPVTPRPSVAAASPVTTVAPPIVAPPTVALPAPALPAAPTTTAPPPTAPLPTAPLATAPARLPPPPAPPPVALATMPNTPRGVGVDTPNAESPKSGIPVLQAPPSKAPEPPPITVTASPPSPFATTTAEPQSLGTAVAAAFEEPPAEPPLPTPAVPDAPPTPRSEVELAAPPRTIEQRAPTMADAPVAPVAAASPSTEETMVAMAAPPSGPSPPEWLVNVDAFADPTRAQQLLDVLTGAGYSAALRTQLVQGVPSYRVVIAGLSTESEADGIVSELEQRYELTSAWVLRTR